MHIELLRRRWIITSFVLKVDPGYPPWHKFLRCSESGLRMTSSEKLPTLAKFGFPSATQTQAIGGHLIVDNVLVWIQKIMNMPPAQEPRSEGLPPDNVESSQQLLPRLPRRSIVSNCTSQFTTSSHSWPYAFVPQYLGTFFKNTHGLGQYQWGPNKSSGEFGATTAL